MAGKRKKVTVPFHICISLVECHFLRNYFALRNFPLQFLFITTLEIFAATHFWSRGRGINYAQGSHLTGTEAKKANLQTIMNEKWPVSEKFSSAQHLFSAARREEKLETKAVCGFPFSQTSFSELRVFARISGPSSSLSKKYIFGLLMASSPALLSSLLFRVPLIPVISLTMLDPEKGNDDRKMTIPCHGHQICYIFHSAFFSVRKSGKWTLTNFGNSCK